MSSKQERKKLVILGGGAAGVLIAMKLAKNPKVDITLVDNKVKITKTYPKHVFNQNA
jgi:NADH dehydrogenase FAD-containing subunit